MTFNIAFFADTHCGYSYGNRDDKTGTNLRVRDGYNALYEIVKDIIAHKGEIDAVAMGGDLFHTSSPTVRDISTVQYYLRALHKANLTIDIIAGNHDANDNRQYPAAVAVVDDPDRGIFAHYQPYVYREIGDGVLLHSVSHHGLHNDDIPVLKPDQSALNVFMTHGAAVDPSNSALMRCMDSPREQIIRPEMILDEAYVLRMFGHYHSRYAIGGAGLNTWYAGSSLRRGFSDAFGPRGWLLFKISDNGDIEVEAHDIFQRPQFDMEVIDGTNMTSDSIQEMIIRNIDATREDEKDGQFNNLRAPILRQRVINVIRSTREGIDRNLLSKRANHALKWQLEFPKPAIVNQEISDGSGIDPKPSNTPSITRTGSLDVAEHYILWRDGSRTLTLIPDVDRDQVDVGAYDHLKKAQDASTSS